MDDSLFDAWTRRRFGLATGGSLATLLGLLRLDETDAKNKKARRRRKRKRKQKRREKRRDNNNPPVDDPDILVIYVDDMREADYDALPRTRALIGGQGATYPNYFMTTPLCAPSRASFFRGQYAHNTGVRNNQDGFQALNAIDESTIATWLRGANPAYRTAHVGKHINGYSSGNQLGPIGPGWTDWIVPEPVAFYDYDLNVNGTREPHGSQKNDYLTDVMLAKAQQIITTTPESTPLFLYFAPKSPHGPSIPADRHKDAPFEPLDQNKPSFNEEAPAAEMADKPDYMQRPPLTPEDIQGLRQSNRDRQRSLLSVDEAIEGLIETLDAAGRLDKTYIFFVTDNGYLLGEHRRTAKNVPYEEAIKMSMLVRGPEVRQGTNDAFVANIDLAPTIADLAGVTPPSYVDGRSIVDTFDGSGNDRQAILIEISPPGSDPEEAIDQFPAEARLLEEQAEAEARAAARVGIAAVGDHDAIRTTDGWVYIEHGTGEQELYNLNEDPFQLESLHADASQSGRIAELSAWLATLRDCDAASCRNAEDSPPD
jgi:N-acetylglucosamine-6-sulfatase